MPVCLKLAVARVSGWFFFFTHWQGKIVPMPTFSYLFLILPLFSSSLSPTFLTWLYFPSLVFPSVWPNGLPQYILLIYYLSIQHLGLVVLPLHLFFPNCWQSMEIPNRSVSPLVSLTSYLPFHLLFSFHCTLSFSPSTGYLFRFLSPFVDIVGLALMDHP